MKKILFLALLAIFLQGKLQAQKSFPGITPINFAELNKSPLHEVRAVWLTTINGLDWPQCRANSPANIEKQKQELRTILDQLQHAGINLVLFQARLRATTIFPSNAEPWDACLSGTAGKSPGYDPLAFAIEECHRRGMQLHAWVVSIPIGKWNNAGCKNLRTKVPNLVKKIGEEGYMNPEMPGTADYIASFCRDITRRYDVDGIHLDYIRYPETWGAIKDRNQARQNITRIVETVHKAVKAEKPWVMMSCSPVGKYADLPRQRSGGWNARDAVCQDAASWMQRGLMDAIFPMMYFKGNNFYPFAIDWQERSGGKIVAPGLGIYFMSPKEKNWPLTDITRELQVLRQYGLGHTYFRSKFFTDNTKGLYDYVAEQYCQYPSLVPAMTWYGFRSPAAPTRLSFNESTSSNTLLLNWDSGKDNSDGSYLKYNIYGSYDYPVSTSDARNIIAVGRRSQSISVPKGMYYAVTAIDRYGNESDARQMPAPSWYHGNGSQKPKANSSFPVIECNNILPINKINTLFSINPSKNIIGIETMQGNLVATYSVTSRIDISNLAPGMYVIRSIQKKGLNHKLAYLKKVK